MSQQKTYYLPLKAQTQMLRESSKLEQAPETTSVIQDQSRLRQIQGQFTQRSSIEQQGQCCVQYVDQGFCKSHPEQRAIFFLSGQPWLKLCKQCALNRALCGHQIEREFSQREFEKKIVVTTLIQDIKGTIEMAQKEGKYLGVLAEKVDKTYMQSLGDTMKLIDQLMKQFNKIRECMYNLYDQNVSKKINYCYQKQTQLIANSSALKKHLQNIQSNYSDVISDLNSGEQQFIRHLKIIKDQIDRTKKLILEDYEKFQIEANFENLIKIFEPKLTQFVQRKSVLQKIQQNIGKVMMEQTASTNKKKNPEKINLSRLKSNSDNNQSKEFRKRQSSFSSKQFMSASKSKELNKNSQKYMSCRRKSIKDINPDQNLSSQSIIQSYRGPSLSLRSMSKKQEKQQQNSSNGTNLRRATRDSKTSILNSLQNGNWGDKIFPF